jgi:hypothetical protein
MKKNLTSPPSNSSSPRTFTPALPKQNKKTQIKRKDENETKMNCPIALAPAHQSVPPNAPFKKNSMKR